MRHPYWNSLSIGSFVSWRSNQQGCCLRECALNPLGFGAVHKCVVRVVTGRIALDTLLMSSAGTCCERCQAKAWEPLQRTHGIHADRRGLTPKGDGHPRLVAAVRESGGTRSPPALPIGNDMVWVETAP